MIKILETKVMRGPNQWSSEEKHLIVQKVAVEETSEADQRAVKAKLLERFPALEGRGDRASLADLVAALAVELQSVTKMTVNYSRSKQSRRQGESYLIFSYMIEQAGVYAGEAAVRIVTAIAAGLQPDIGSHLTQLEDLKSRYSIGPTSTYLLNEVKKRKIPFQQFKHGSLITLGHGVNQKKIRTAVTDHTSALGLEIAGDKEETKDLLADANLPVPRGILVRSERELRERLHEVKFPLVIKPLNGNHGRGVTTDINTEDKALFGFTIAQRISRTVIVEEFIRGDDYRFLVIDFRMVAVARRMPAYVTGDGKSTIQQLIDEENKNPQRGDTSEHVLALIRVDDVTMKLLHDRSLTLESVPKSGERVILKDTANISAGGTAEDVTDLVHPENKFMVERVARLFNLDICGVDIMTTSVETPITRETGAIIEVNAGPGLRMHSNPQKGLSRDVAGPIMDMLFPNAATARIPIVAVTGTNGKTTTTRLIAHMARHAGFRPGYCTSDGIYLDNHLVFEGDCTGYVSARQVLFDPSIDFAVLECARGGIIRSGLGFDQCDVSIVTNIASDHLGMHDIDTIEDMARVKAVVARSCSNHGYTILNADCDKTYGLYESLQCNVALFSLDANNERVKKHTAAKGMAAVVENGFITIINGPRLLIDHIDNIPLSFGGKADFMVQNILAATLAGIISGFNSTVIRSALISFVPSPALTPGRMNLFSFDNFRVMVDYVHNSDGFAEIGKFLQRVEDSPKTGIISIAGDRRDADILSLGAEAARCFDRIIIRSDKDPRDRDHKEVAALLKEGIASVKRDMQVQVIPDEKEAITAAVQMAEKGSFIFICADKVKQTLKMVHEMQQDMAVH